MKSVALSSIHVSLLLLCIFCAFILPLYAWRKYDKEQKSKSLAVLESQIIQTTNKYYTEEIEILINGKYTKFTNSFKIMTMNLPADWWIVIDTNNFTFHIVTNKP